MGFMLRSKSQQSFHLRYDAWVFVEVRQLIANGVRSGDIPTSILLCQAVVVMACADTNDIECMGIDKNDSFKPKLRNNRRCVVGKCFSHSVRGKGRTDV